MSIYHYILLGWLAFSALTLVSRVGRPREPLTGHQAATSLVILATLAWVVTQA